LENGSLPKCQKCDRGVLVPLSDFGSQGAPIHYKAWVCTNPDCGYNIKSGMVKYTLMSLSLTELFILVHAENTLPNSGFASLR